MPHVLVAGKIDAAGLTILQQADGITFDYVEEVSEESYRPYLANADGLVIRTQPLTSASIEMAEKLRIVSRHGVGYDSVDLQALQARGIALAIVGDVNSQSVAEHTIGLLFALSKKTLASDAAVRNGDWAWRDRDRPFELAQKNLLVVGMGRIGRRVAELASRLGMSVRGYDPKLPDMAWPDLGYGRETDLHLALASADIVTVCVPKGDKPLIGAPELSAMKRTALLVNTARGGVVDEAALAAAISKGEIAGAGVDVFDDEPPLRSNPLLHSDRVIVSPHVAGLTVESARRMSIASVRNVLDYFEGRLDPDLLVGKPAESA